MPPPLPFDVQKATAQLAEADPILAKVIERAGPCLLAPAAKVDLFQALLRSIIYQQLHGKAAAAIHGRVLALTGRRRLSPASLQTIRDDQLRASGLSANKLLAIRDLAAKTLDGTVPSARVAVGLEAEELIQRLTVIRGIGPWTVQMLLIFHLGHPDILPTGDFAIRRAFSLLYRRGRKVTPESLIRHARRWQPYRSVASWYLWRSFDTVLPVPPDSTVSLLSP